MQTDAYIRYFFKENPNELTDEQYAERKAEVIFISRRFSMQKGL
jgi:hypothetical protein